MRLPDCPHPCKICIPYYVYSDEDMEGHGYMLNTVDYYIFIYQFISLLPSLSNEAKIRLTPRVKLWNRVSSNQPEIN